MCREHRSRKRASSAWRSWSSRFCKNVRCCITALLTWLRRKSMPRSISATLRSLVVEVNGHGVQKAGQILKRVEQRTLDPLTGRPGRQQAQREAQTRRVGNESRKVDGCRVRLVCNDGRQVRAGREAVRRTGQYGAECCCIDVEDLCEPVAERARQ